MFYDEHAHWYMCSARLCGEANQGIWECRLRVLIVRSLSVFYVTTTHCFSSPYGGLPGMCFLSLFLMTWVTSPAPHMLERDWPTCLALENRRKDMDFKCSSMITLNFQSVSVSVLWPSLSKFKCNNNTSLMNTFRQITVIFSNVYLMSKSCRVKEKQNKTERVNCCTVDIRRVAAFPNVKD